MERAESDILSNSSMQQTPWSDSTSAPLSSTISFVSGSCGHDHSESFDCGFHDRKALVGPTAPARRSPAPSFVIGSCRHNHHHLIVLSVTERRLLVRQHQRAALQHHLLRLRVLCPALVPDQYLWTTVNVSGEWDSTLQHHLPRPRVMHPTAIAHQCVGSSCTLPHCITQQRHAAPTCRLLHRIESLRTCATKCAAALFNRRPKHGPKHPEREPTGD